MKDKAPGLITGKLYLIPSTLGDTAPLEVLPLSVRAAIDQIDHYIVENEKTARHFIKKITPQKSQPNLKIEVLNKYTEAHELPTFLEPCIHGINVGLLSEAGCPAIADPGAEIVKIAHQKNIPVVPLVGPSSILMALMGSGMNGQNFAFNGYLPIESAERKSAIKKFEKASKESNQTQIFIETPYRNEKLFIELKKHLKPETRLCIATDITLETESIVTKTINEWQRIEVAINKRPTIFIFQA
ncbi:SAM-dependent methyltransferase [Allomuricauda sp. d1]|uniref:SAM-dependent methyltransferase n=1 Tax=Allomuricauda sp. d1 TaxID=3136725 RepID=UPI0031D38B3A